MPGQKELNEFGGILITIRSRKSYFEVTKVIEAKLQRFSQFPETLPSEVPRRLDTEMVKVFEDAA
jgi:hypothetical protein